MLRTVGLVIFVMLVGCSTAGKFVLPQGTHLKIAGRDTKPASHGHLQTRAFSWGSSGGAAYQLLDESGNVVREGKLRTHFRFGTVFVPIPCLVLWPQGLRRDGIYDLTKPADGNMVIDAPPGPSAMR